MGRRKPEGKVRKRKAQRKQRLAEQKRKGGSCRSKMAYDTAKAAHAARRRLEARGAEHLNVYTCVFCGKYHVGTKKP